MKLITKVIALAFLTVFLSCQNEPEELFEDDAITNDNSTTALEKNYLDINIVCSVEGIPPGWNVDEYINSPNCPNYNLFFGRYNAAIISRDGTPKINRAGAGCQDNYCIWIVGENFESNAYVDIRTTTGSSIIGTYRGSNRTLTTNAQGQQVITLRLGSAYERSQFASRGLRIWVVNPQARKWADGRTVRRPGDIIIDPPCNPICP
ncbi:hypothetical protein [Aquimarina brevivitae]|uniref:Uncharacterized protein n=1 Tax=Aquimarina brevivitae TaxID=323412 RepID=A0A4Q7P205_9FLAO|nr:hypothetical protein [Aquimarina brevivitae]RZS93901.1 hypothetical protein EV197_2482 [Aquimarina brevivitae]